MEPIEKIIDFDAFYNKSAFVKATGISKKDFAVMWGRIVQEATAEILEQAQRKDDHDRTM